MEAARHGLKNHQEVRVTRFGAPARQCFGSVKSRYRKGTLTPEDAAVSSGNSNVNTGRPLGTLFGTNLRKCRASARSSRSPLRTKSTSQLNSSFVRCVGRATSGSIRAKTGLIGPSGPLKSRASPAAAGLYFLAEVKTS